ncbi:hypothetical protein [Hydrogenimonas thermophila]|uniref:Uncharacterized protein n=1 Tax=Hydrogenimonas thermophila TaxID=223786 RepID=A0A1I5ULC9_9BACT|nr:hypothetical protein [Hydrogenimonas thermophila]SFP96121.1 hypothetical protein SAMN05216234_1653 [Hydrogenimonas thermophila]
MLNFNFMPIANIIILFLFMFWAIQTYLEIQNSKSLTREEKFERSDIMLSLFLINFAIMSIVSIFVYFVETKFREQKWYFYSAGLFIFFLLNMFLSKKISELKFNNADIKAKILTNFKNLKSRKKNKFEKYVNEDIDLDYYHFKKILNKKNLTVEALELNNLTKLELKNFEKTVEKEKELKKLSVVLKNLINYVNNIEDEYNIENITKDDIKGMKRIEVEELITKKFIELKNRNIPIRISQLLQYTRNEREKQFLYFLMGLPAGRFVANGIIYALYFAKKKVI